MARAIVDGEKSAPGSARRKGADRGASALTGRKGGSVQRVLFFFDENPVDESDQVWYLVAHDIGVERAGAGPQFPCICLATSRA